MARPTGFTISAIFCALCLLTIVPATADLIAPAITHVYFEKDDTPFNDTVDYSVNCYGYPMPFAPVTQTIGTYQPELVFHYSASCRQYGCEIYQPYYYRAHIDWCDLEGNAGGRHFLIRNFSSRPYSRCDWLPERIEKRVGDLREYYYVTPEYSECRNFERNVTSEWYASRIYYSEVPGSYNRTSVIILPGQKILYRTPPYNSTLVTRSGISLNLSQYIAFLETCNPIVDPACGGNIIDGKPLKTFTEYRTFLTNATELQENPCDRFLIKADPSLIMPFTDPDPWHHMCAEGACNFTMELCESRFTIPSEDTSAGPGQTGSPAMTRNETVATIVSSPAPSTAVTVPPVLRSPVESLYCAIVQAFGGRCE